MALFATKQADRLDRVTTKQTGMPSNQINMIGDGTLLEGTIESSGDIRISGRIIGKLRVTGKIIVAQEGVVEGELTATSADIAGSVQGDLFIEDKLLLRSTALVEGDVITARLIVEEGAVFDGSCKMASGKLINPPLVSVESNGQLDLEQNDEGDIPEAPRG